MLTETINSIKVHLNERASSPLLGAFVISLILINYRFLLVVVSDLPIDEKFGLIDNTIYPSTKDLVLNTILYPFLNALTFIVVYPLPAWVVYWYTGWVQIQMKKKQQKLEDDIPLTKAQSAGIRRGFRQLQVSYETHSQELQTKNETLQSEIKTLIESAAREKDKKYILGVNEISLLYNVWRSQDLRLSASKLIGDNNNFELTGIQNLLAKGFLKYDLVKNKADPTVYVITQEGIFACRYARDTPGDTI